MYMCSPHIQCVHHMAAAWPTEGNSAIRIAWEALHAILEFNMPMSRRMTSLKARVSFLNNRLQNPVFDFGTNFQGIQCVTKVLSNIKT